MKTKSKHLISFLFLGLIVSIDSSIFSLSYRWYDKKTDKSALTKILENSICMTDDPEHYQPAHVDVLIIDGMFLLHQQKQLPATLGV